MSLKFKQCFENRTGPAGPAGQDPEPIPGRFSTAVRFCISPAVRPGAGRSGRRFVSLLWPDLNVNGENRKPSAKK
ncbi:hypothetical protein Hanom_Chr06g00500401 [Helianthus anomalus]